MQQGGLLCLQVVHASLKLEGVAFAQRLDGIQEKRRELVAMSTACTAESEHLQGKISIKKSQAQQGIGIDPDDLCWSSLDAHGCAMAIVS